MTSEVKTSLVTRLIVKEQHFQFCLPGESESILKVAPAVKTIYTHEKTKFGNWITKPAGLDYEGYFLVVRHGHTGITKILQHQPDFFEILLDRCSDPNDYYWSLQRIDLSANFGKNLLENIKNSIKKKRYNSFGHTIIGHFNTDDTIFLEDFTNRFGSAKIRAKRGAPSPKNLQFLGKGKIAQNLDTSALSKEEKETLNFVQEVSGSKKTRNSFKNSVNLGKTSFSHSVLTQQDWEKVQTVSIGDFKESSIVTVIYKKQSEQFIRKNQNRKLFNTS